MRSAPACLSATAQASSVLCVVVTSSMRSTLSPFAAEDAENAFATFFARSNSLSVVWVCVNRVRRSSCGFNFRLRRLVSDLAISSLWLYVRSHCLSGWSGTGTTASMIQSDGRSMASAKNGASRVWLLYFSAWMPATAPPLYW